MGYTITVQPAARSFVADQGEAVLVAAIREGIGLPYGCRDGACGSCKCRLLEGEVDQQSRRGAALSAADAAQGFILACCSVPRSDLVLESRQATFGDVYPIRKLPSRVVGMERRSQDVMLLTLQLPAGNPVLWRPGQYVDVVLRDGVRRSYSMANVPGEGASLELHLRHMPGGRFTDHVFGAMKPREILRLEGPFGSFFLREDSAAPIVLLASGTGFAPIKAIIGHMQQRGIVRPAVLYWGARRPADLYLADWVHARVAEMPNLRFVPVVSDALPEDRWTGRAGFVHRAVMEDFPDLSAHEVYACGAPVVVEAARADFIHRCALREDAFFADSFTSEKDKLAEQNP